jgi:peptide deformylase
MEMPIIIYGSPILRKKSLEFDRETDFNLLAGNMLETLKKQNGIGLAGPQVGILKNIFVVDTSSLENQAIERVEKVYINPEILNYSTEEIYYNEGCLSIPGIFEDVIRPDKIEVRYRNENFDVKEESLNGIVARIFQHEYDHLQGILFIDRLSSLSKRMIKSKLKQIARSSI